MTIPTNFGFWIADFRSSDGNLEENAFINSSAAFNTKSKIDNPKSFNDVRSRKYVRRNREADLLGGFQVDHQLKLGRLLDRQIRRLDSLQDLLNEQCGAVPAYLIEFWTVCQEIA